MLHDYTIIKILYTAHGVLYTSFCEIIEKNNQIMKLKLDSHLNFDDAQNITVIYDSNDTGIYYYYCTILEKHSDIVSFKIISEENITQRRRYFRVHAKLPVNIMYNNKEYNLFTEDISAGGIKVLTKHDFEVQKEVTLMLKLEKEELSINANFVRSIKRPECNEYGLEFSIDDHTRLKIVEFISKKIIDDTKKHYLH